MPTAVPERRPMLLVVLVGLVALEAGLLVGLAGFSLVTGISGGDPGLSLATAALAAIIGGFLGLAALGLWRGRRWARGPVITWQLLQAAVSAPELAQPGRWVAAVLVVLGVVVVVGLLTPAVTRATSSTADPPVT